ncbi:hypothetical protein SBA5_100062 [Candidatus Sulfotelmatomonas gaucii]|uniref:Uncharacterized protein n=1 Tax=Candidatus Sulfuritelmatomonas gaucii TaxID=2043161 RepID=A0A2N9L355_9BACT|nr:hypothetical protein SBA5_100062 [Candidatus Sulfotelmatomonas gaucii]
MERGDKGAKTERNWAPWERARSVLGGLGLADVREKARMRRAALGVVFACLVETELAVDRKANFCGVAVFLPVVFPPANGTQNHRCRSVQGFISAAWATILGCDSLHLY